MCKFYSAIVTRSGNLYHKSSLISHEDIIDYYQLKDNTLHDNLCRVEFYPDDISDNLDVSKYNLHIDENVIPYWFDIELKESVISRLKDVISNMIISVSGGHSK